LLLLAGWLGMTALALAGWCNSLHPPPRPGELRRLSGSVSSVRRGRGRYGRVSDLHFRLAAAGPELDYVSFYPSFPEAVACLRPGAPVTVGATAATSDVWRLKCGGTLLADIETMAEARRANGRYALYLAIAFGLGDLFWVWRIFSAGPGARKARPKDQLRA